MGEKISGYTADATSNPIKTVDLLDFSNEDGAAAYDVSKKILVSEFITFLNGTINNVYNANDTLTGPRTITAATNFLKQLGGDVIVETIDEISDYAFLIQDASQAERGRFGLDVGTGSAILTMNTISGEWFSAVDEVVNINTDILHVNATNIGMGTASPLSSNLLDVNVVQGGLNPLCFYKDRVGGASVGDVMQISFDFNDSIGVRQSGTSNILSRVIGTGAGNVDTSLILSNTLQVRSVGANTGAVVIHPSANTQSATAFLDVRQTASSTFNTALQVQGKGNTASQIVIWAKNLAGNTLFYVDGTSKFFFNVNQLTTGDFQMNGGVDANTFYMNAGTDRVGFGIAAPLGKVDIDQNNATGAIPALKLNQDDLSEEFIEFAGTIAVGNPIEAIGAKTLTTTHFLKVTITGGLTRYIPIGTIA